jgi:D-3-phosphoglycerate dehydrogenase
MTVIAHDPFIAQQAAANMGIELVSMDELCARADYLSLHMPSTPQTKRTFNAERLAKCKKGLRLVNTARGDLIDEAALAAAIESGHIGGAALDVFESEPTKDHTLQKLAKVVASPHIAASTREGQELVGVETASALRDFLKSGVIRNAVNFPAVAPDEFQRLQPYMSVGEQLGALVGQMGEARIESVGVRYYGELAGQHPLIVNAVLVGLFKATLSEPVTAVNAKATAVARGIDIVESSSSRTRNFRSLLSVKLVTDAGERWVEATVADRNPRLVLLNGVPVEAPLSGTLLLISNNDQPGVIGDVGTILGRQGVNIANFALGRDSGGAVGVVNVDAPAGVVEGLLDQLRSIAAVKHVWLVQV